MTVVAVVLLIAGGSAAWAATRRSSNAAAATPTTLTAIATSTLRQTVTATGTVSPAHEADLSFTASSTVTSVAVSVGQRVAKGAVLATVDDDALKATLSAAKSSLDAAQAQVDSSASTTQQAAVAAQIAATTSRVQQAQEAVDAATLVAPFAGTVATVGIAVGDVTGGSSSGGGSGGSGAATGSGSGSTSGSSADVVVIDTAHWVVDAAVGAADLAQVRKGLQAEITPTGATGKVFGTVASVGVVASSSTSGTSTFPVTIDVTGSPTGLYAGSSADVVIVVKQLNDVLTVPTAAVRTVGGKTVVTKSVGGKQVVTPVVLGTTYGPSTRVVSGLVAGDQVVTPSFRPGAARAGTGRTGGTNGGFPGGGFPGGVPGGGLPGAGG